MEHQLSLCSTGATRLLQPTAGAGAGAGNRAEAGAGNRTWGKPCWLVIPSRMQACRGHSC